jgi:hypothetical protein
LEEHTGARSLQFFMSAEDRAYLSVVEWPGGFGEAEQVEALAGGAGLDPHQAALCVRRGFPQVVACLTPERGAGALAGLRRREVTAFAPLRSAMREAPAPVAIKALAAREGGAGRVFDCEAWRGESPVLHTGDISLIVHGRVASSETRVSVDSSSGMATGWWLGGPEGAVIGAAMSEPSAERSTRQTGNAQVLDLFLRSGARIRIAGSRFNFDVLGGARGRNNHENAAALLATLARLNPRAIVDDGFAGFRCPPDVVRSHWKDAGAGSVTRTTNAPAFDFYSLWAWMMYREFAGM